jgi:hypothetical protein
VEGGVGAAEAGVGAAEAGVGAAEAGVGAAEVGVGKPEAGEAESRGPAVVVSVLGPRSAGLLRARWGESTASSSSGATASAASRSDSSVPWSALGSRAFASPRGWASTSGRSARRAVAGSAVGGVLACVGVVLGDAEIEHLDEVLIRVPVAKKDVGGLEISVHELHRVGFAQRPADLTRDVERPGHRQRAVVAEHAL